jgi:hypothetical protein
LILLLLGPRLAAQEVRPVVYDPLPPVYQPGPTTVTAPAAVWPDGPAEGGRSPLASNRNFSNFIGFMSNPLQNIDPRSLTQIVPIFLSSWVSTTPALPNVDAQVYGPALSLALTDRLSVGMNQGGLAFAHIDRTDPRGPLLDRLAGTRGREFGGTREWALNIGGYAQYTLVEDVEDQFLATAGLRVVVPCGSQDLFQGIGPALLAPYLTVGKEFGQFHLLATGGYQFPARSGDKGTELFYLNAHLDRQCFGWIYPLVEVNWTNHTTSVPLELPTRHGYFDLGNFESTGNVVTVAAGVNLVLIRDRLEFGGVYSRAVGTQHNIDIDSMLLKLVLRY